MKLDPEAVRSRLKSKVVGAEIRCVDACVSTNDLAWAAAGEGAPDGTAIFAEEQSKGRGRFGRTWAAAPGQALLCSMILRPRLEADRVPLVTVLAALAAADVVGPRARIRFPNDVMLDGLKIAGILVEARFVSSRPDVFVVGVGLNVTGHPEGFGATSIGPAASRTAAARALLEAVDDWYARLGGPLLDYRRAWRERSFILGKRVRVKQDGRAFVGTVEEVDPIDGLVVRLESGQPRSVRGEHVEHLEVLA